MNHTVVERTEPPRFLIQHEAVYAGWWDSLKTLCVPAKLSASNQSAYLFRNSPEDEFAPASRSFSVSLLLHCSFILLLFHLPLASSTKAKVELTAIKSRRIYYQIPLLDPSRTLPHINAAVLGESSGSDSRTHRLPSQKGAIFAGNLAVVSKPLRPDNTRQTILQPNMPPDLRIATEIKLPNIVMDRPAEVPKIPLTFNPDDTKPIQKDRQSTVKAVPSIPSATNPDAPKLALLNTSNPRPQLPIPSFAISKPVQSPRETEAEDPNSVPSRETESNLTLPDVSNSRSRLPIPSFTVAKPVQKSEATEIADPSGVPSTGTGSSSALPDASNSQARLPIPSFAVAKPIQEPRGTESESADASSVLSAETGSRLIVMSVDPSTPVPQISLPPGSRQGAFTISPPTEKAESPGRTNGIATGDKTTSPASSEGRSATGSSGKDEKSASMGILSIASEGGKAEASGALGPALPPNVVFPVAVASNLRKNAIVVFSGPAGGGGLDVYGALHCGKIYTIFLSMPGKNWTMQYCVKAEVPETTVSNARSVVIHLDEGLVPPDPESRFDYRRLPVPADKLHKMIVLKGTLREDGTVGALQLYQGVLPQMDEAARIAFGRWKFKPAMQGGKPVAVEILVGIPTEAVGHHTTH